MGRAGRADFVKSIAVAGRSRRDMAVAGAAKPPSPSKYTRSHEETQRQRTHTNNMRIARTLFTEYRMQNERGLSDLREAERLLELILREDPDCIPAAKLVTQVRAAIVPEQRRCEIYAHNTLMAACEERRWQAAKLRLDNSGARSSGKREKTQTAPSSVKAPPAEATRDSGKSHCSATPRRRTTLGGWLARTLRVAVGRRRPRSPRVRPG